MPCTVSPEEIEYYNEQERKQWKKDGRWDKLATREELAQWLCEVLRANAGPYLKIPEDAFRWYCAHRKFNDKDG